MRGSNLFVVGSVLVAFGVVGSAQAQDPIGPAATAAPSVIGAPQPAAPAPQPAPAIVAVPAAEPAPSAPAEAAPASLAPVGQPMRDPFRSDGAVTMLAPAGTAPTTTTTTTVVVTDRVITVPHQPPPAPPARERFFVGGYGGFGGRMGPTVGRLSIFSNMRGGVLLGKRLSIGASMVTMTKRTGAPIQGISGKTYQIGLAYGGVQIGLVAMRRGRFEIGLDTLLGAGIACIYERRPGQHDGDCRESVKMFVAEPGAFIHFNLTNWMRVGFNGGYRFVSQPQWPSGAQFRLASPYFGANLDFGWFRRRDTGR